MYSKTGVNDHTLYGNALNITEDNQQNNQTVNKDLENRVTTLQKKSGFLITLKLY